MFVPVQTSVITRTAGLLCDSSMTSFAKGCSSTFLVGSPGSSASGASYLEQQFGVKPIKGQEGSSKLEVVAGPSTPTVTRATGRTSSIVGRYALAASKAKTRKGRRGGGGGWDDDSSFWLSSDGWDGWDGGNMDGLGGNGGGWNGGWNRGPSSGDDFFYRATVHGMWLWQVMCALCLMQVLHFLMFPKPAGASEGPVATSLVCN